MSDTLSAVDTQFIFESCPLPALVLDSSGTIISYNQAFADMAGLPRLTKSVADNVSTIKNHPLHDLTEFRPDLEWKDPSGQIHTLRVDRLSLPDSCSREVRFYYDQSKEKQLENTNRLLEEKLQQNTLTDPSTGLLNQRGIMLALEPQIARCRRYNSTLSVVMLSVDAPVPRVKLLIEVGRLLKDQLRWADLVGCTDEQDFLLALPETPEDAASQLADKLKPLINELSDKFFAGVTIWFCYGLAGWRKNDSASSLVLRTSSALAQARSEESAETVAF